MRFGKVASIIIDNIPFVAVRMSIDVVGQDVLREVRVAKFLPSCKLQYAGPSGVITLTAMV